MIQRPLRLKLIVFFAILLVIDWVLYFRHIGHFFQGDTVFLLAERAHSLSGYLKEFTTLNPSGWYRPLTNELVESVLYPFAGLHPIPYRIPVYVVFVAITIAVYLLAFTLTRRHLAAAIACTFFTIHTANAYTTYDVGFLPELLFTFFYVAAILAYLRYLENNDTRSYWASVACFVGSLLSKESAMTLPATLFLAHLFFARQLPRERWASAVRSLVPHSIVLAVYVAFVVGHLGVMGLSVTKLFDTSQKPNPGDYIAVINRDALKNADVAMSWAFNIPRQGFGQPQSLTAGMLGYLKVFRAAVLLLIAAGLVTKFQRSVLVFGMAWFWITVAPALPLVSHFLPYYVFSSMIGLALVVGVIFTKLFDQLARVHPLAANACIVSILAGVLYATAPVIRTDIRDNSLLGGSSTLAWNTLNDLRSFHPQLPHDSKLYFADAVQPLSWPHHYGALIKMAYGMDALSILYESNGDRLSPATTNVFVFGVRDMHLTNETAAYHSNPGPYLKLKQSDLKLGLSASEVIAGRDQYTLRIPSLNNVDVQIAYSVDNDPLEIFSARLDQEGKVSFDVAQGTRAGVYRFWGFTIAGTNEWIRSERILTVRAKK